MMTNAKNEGPLSSFLLSESQGQQPPWSLAYCIHLPSPGPVRNPLVFFPSLRPWNFFPPPAQSLAALAGSSDWGQIIISLRGNCGEKVFGEWILDRGASKENYRVSSSIKQQN